MILSRGNKNAKAIEYPDLACQAHLEVQTEIFKIKNKCRHRTLQAQRLIAINLQTAQGVTQKNSEDISSRYYDFLKSISRLLQLKYDEELDFYFIAKERTLEHAKKTQLFTSKSCQKIKYELT